MEQWGRARWDSKYAKLYKYGQDVYNANLPVLNTGFDKKFDNETKFQIIENLWNTECRDFCIKIAEKRKICSS